MVFLSSHIPSQIDAFKDFEQAVVSSQSYCSSRKLREYDFYMEEIIQDEDFARFDKSVQERVYKVRSMILHRLRNNGARVIQGIETWLRAEPLHMNALRKAYPKELNEIVSFIVRKAKKLCDKGGFLGSSVVKELLTSSGKNLVVKYRLRRERLQVLVHENIKQGTFSLVQKVVIAAGLGIKGVSDAVFARLKLNPFMRFEPCICAQVRRAAAMSRIMRRLRVRNIVEYTVISRKRKGSTLATTLYKEDVFELLKRFPAGPLTSKRAFFFLTKIAISLAKALSDLHRKGVVHLDVKPENVLLSKSDEAFLGDFGTYRKIDVLEHDEITTPTVAALEIFCVTKPWRVTSALDMWAFGLFLFDLFYGIKRNHFCNNWPDVSESFSEKEKGQYIVSQAAKMVNEIQNNSSFEGFHVPSKLAALITQLLNFDPKDRPRAGCVLKQFYVLRDSWNVEERVHKLKRSFEK